MVKLSICSSHAIKFFNDYLSTLRIENSSYLTSYFGSLICETDAERLSMNLAKLIILVGEEFLSINFLSGMRVKFNPVEFDNENQVSKESALNDTSKYRKTNSYKLIDKKIKSIKKTLNCDAPLIKNNFYNEKLKNYLLTNLTPFFILWSSIYSERTTNSNVECWNKIVKKDIMNKSPSLKPGRLMKKTRNYVLSKLKFLNLKIKPTPNKRSNNSAETAVEIWGPKNPKKEKKSRYFPTLLSSDYDFLKLKEEDVENIQDLYLNSFVILISVNFKYNHF